MRIKTPYYVFDRELFSGSVREYSKYGKVFFPVKANDHGLIISEILKENCGFEVDSIEHIEKLIRHGASAKDLSYSFPIREETDIRRALKKGVGLFVIDSVEEYQKITRVSSTANFVVRINVLDVLDGKLPPEQNKWGLSIREATNLISTIRHNKQNLAGISFYITSELDRDGAFEIVLDAIGSSFVNLGVDFVNIGGGISRDRLKTIAPRLETVKKSVGAKHIVIEPGRHLLDPCIDMIVSVVSIRQMAGNRLVFINSGIYSGLLDAVVKSRKYAVVDQRGSASAFSSAYICGSSSDISDTLGVYDLRTNLAIGDTLIIKGCGAYSAVMQTHFCGKDHVHMVLKAAGVTSS
jgi:diaminopimelate decarboxylase